jgi:hypothetical protein
MIHTEIHSFINTEILENFILQKNYKETKASLLIQLFLISTDKEYIKNIQETLRTLLPHSHIIGTTTDGSISTEDFNRTVISFSEFEKSTLAHTFESFELGKEDLSAKAICRSIINPKSKLLILFADGLLCNAERLTKEIHQEFPNLIIAGGLAGDNAKLQKTLVCDNTHLNNQSVVALSIESDSLYIHNDYNLAWESIGQEMLITKAEGNIISEIDGEVASHIFEKYLNTQQLNKYDTSDSNPTITIEFPLIIKREDMNVARTTMKILEDGSLFCTGEFKTGDILQFSFTDTDKIINSGLELSSKMKQIPVETMFIYSCMARRRFMGENISYDLEPLYGVAPLSGFYSYGEIFTTPHNVEFLNHTMTILALSEEDEIYTKKLSSQTQTNKHKGETVNALKSLLLNSTPTETKNNLFSLSEELCYNTRTLELFLERMPIKLTKSESLFFQILFENRGLPVKTELLFEYIWGEKDREFNATSIRTLVKKLRKKLPQKTIESLYGGYYKLLVN